MQIHADGHDLISMTLPNRGRNIASEVHCCFSPLNTPAPRPVTELSIPDSLRPNMLVQPSINAHVSCSHHLLGEFADLLDRTRSSFLKSATTMPQHASNCILSVVAMTQMVYISLTLYVKDFQCSLG